MASVPQQTPFNKYTANGSTTIFPFEFQVLAAADLKVRVNGALVPPSSYGVSGLNSQSGGSINFLVAPASGAKVLLSREMILARDIDYQYNGDLRSETVNRDMNRIWLALQEQQAAIASTIRAPFPTAFQELNGDPTLYAGFSIVMSAGGQPTFGAPIAGGAGALEATLATTDGSGMLGYSATKNYVVGTIGASLRECVRVWEFPFLAKCDGVTNDTAAIQAALDTGLDVKWRNSPSYTDIVISTRGQKLSGEGMGRTDCVQRAGGKGIVILARNVTLEDFRILPTGSVNGVQSSVVADCITIGDVASANSYIEALRVSRVMFENIKGCAVRLIAPLRESKFEQCRFRAMGNVATGDGVVHMNNLSTSSRSPNNLWFVNCLWYQFGTPCINFAISGTSAAGRGEPPFGDIYLVDCLVHGQLLDEGAVPSPYSVRAELTEQVYIRGIENLILRGCKFTATHPNRVAVRVDSFTAYSTNRVVKIHECFFSYNDQAIANPSGGYVRVTDCIDTDISHNTAVGGYFGYGASTGYDFDIRDSGTHSSVLVTNFEGNLSFNQFGLKYNYPAAFPCYLRTPDRISIQAFAPGITFKVAGALAYATIDSDGSGSILYSSDPTSVSSGSAHRFKTDNGVEITIDSSGVSKAVTAAGVSSTGAASINAGSGAVNLQVGGVTQVQVDAFNGLVGVKYIKMTPVVSTFPPPDSYFVNSAGDVPSYKNAAGTVTAL